MPQQPSLLFLLSGIGMMLVAVYAVLLWQRGKPSLRAAFGFGAVAWAIAVALKVAWAVPMNKLIHAGLNHVLGKAAGGPSFWLYIGLLTGIFECGITLAFVAKTRLKKANWDDAVAFGIGFGAAEALVLGMVSCVSLVAIVLFFNQIPAGIKAQLVKGYGGGLALIPVPIMERLSALVVHVFSCVLIVYSARAEQLRWFWLSFAYKTAVDGFAAWAILSFSVKESLARMIQVEATLGVFALVTLPALWALKGKFITPQNSHRLATGPGFTG